MNNLTKNLNNYSQEEGIVFESLFNIVKRNFKFITIITGALTVGTIVGSYFIKPVYRGSFEIVVEISDQYKKNQFGGGLLQLTNVVSDSANLKTQEVVLRSPSVLLPVFNFVKNNNPSFNSESKLDYQSWINQELNIVFKKGTNVLSISYENQNKEFIIDVLNKISRKYKEFSKSDKEKKLNKTIEYLKNQQKVYSDKARISRKELNLFAIENGLGDIDGFVDLDKTTSESNFDLDQFENSNINEIFNNRDLSSDKRSSGASQRFKNQFRMLEKYEVEYTNLSSVLKENSEVLQNLKRKIEKFRTDLKRPNEILLKYRELRNIANRDEQILKSINDDYAMFQLEKFKQLDAWKMISEPTIEKGRVSPQRSKLASIALLIGFLLSYFVAFYREKKTGLIYELNELNSKIDCNFLETIYINKKDLSQQLIEGILNSYKEHKVGLIEGKLIEIEKETIVKEKSLSFLNKFKTLNIKDTKLVNNFDKLILLIEEGKFTNKQLIVLNKYINIYKSKIIGFIYVGYFN